MHRACADRFKSDGVPVLRGRSGHGLLPLTKVIATDSHQQREKLVFANGVSLGILTTLQCRPWCSEVVGQHKTDLWYFYKLVLLVSLLVSFDGVGHSDIDL